MLHSLEKIINIFMYEYIRHLYLKIPSGHNAVQKKKSKNQKKIKKK